MAKRGGFNPLGFHNSQRHLPIARRRKRSALLGIDRVDGAAWATLYHDGIPQEMVDWFRGRYDIVADAEWSEPEGGGGRYVPRPLRPPSFAAFAAHLGVGRETLADWEERHPDFKAAAGACRALIEAFMVDAGAQGALNPQVASLILKNMLGWRDKTDVELGGKVTLHFDRQDESA